MQGVRDGTAEGTEVAEVAEAAADEEGAEEDPDDCALAATTTAVRTMKSLDSMGAFEFFLGGS